MKIFRIVFRFNRLLRDLLKRNEIYFTTIAAILLSFMAIYVSIKANLISTRQANMDYYENSPDFHIQQDYIYNDNNNEVKGRSLKVILINGRAKNIRLDTRTFLNVELMDNSGKMNNKDLYLMNYYSNYFWSGSGVGEICRIEGGNNRLKYIDMKNKLPDLLKERGYELALINKSTYVKISYVNFLKEDKTEYYRLGFDGGKIISDSEVESIKTKFFKEIKYYLSQHDYYNLDFYNFKDYTEIVNEILDD